MDTIKEVQSQILGRLRKKLNNDEMADVLVLVALLCGRAASELDPTVDDLRHEVGKLLRASDE